MIEYNTGDILREEVDAIINTVDCVGVMGRGIALQLRKSFRIISRRMLPPVKITRLSRGDSHLTPTANALIKALIKLGILKEMTGQQRWRSYVFDPYFRLFLS